MEKLVVGKMFVVRTGENCYEMIEYVGKDGDIHVFKNPGGGFIYMIGAEESLYPASKMVNDNVDRKQLRSLANRV